MAPYKCLLLSLLLLLIQLRHNLLLEESNPLLLPLTMIQSPTWRPLSSARYYIISNLKTGTCFWFIVNDLIFSLRATFIFIQLRHNLPLEERHPLLLFDSLLMILSSRWRLHSSSASYDIICNLKEAISYFLHWWWFNHLIEHHIPLQPVTT